MQQSKSPVACPMCKGSRFVCENHPLLARPSECECGAGDPCPICNVADPPALPEDFVVHIEADALNAALDDFAKKDKGPRAPIWWPTGNGSSTNQDFADHDGSKAAQSHRPNITRAA